MATVVAGAGALAAFVTAAGAAAGGTTADVGATSEEGVVVEGVGAMVVNEKHRTGSLAKLKCARGGYVCVMSRKQLSHRFQQDKINKGKKAKQITFAHMGAAFSTE